MKKKITVIACLMFVAAMMMFAQPAMSGKWADTPSGLDLQILSVSLLGQELVEVEEELVRHVYLLILGYNFGNGYEPIVKLAATPGLFLEGGNTNITHEGEALWGLIVICPVSILTFLDLPDYPANLLLTVQTGASVHQFDTFNVMLPVMPDEPEPLNTSDFLLLLQ